MKVRRLNAFQGQIEAFLKQNLCEFPRYSTLSSNRQESSVLSVISSLEDLHFHCPVCFPREMFYFVLHSIDDLSRKFIRSHSQQSFYLIGSIRLVRWMNPAPVISFRLVALAASYKFWMLSSIRHNNLLPSRATVSLASLQHRYTARNIAYFHILINAIVKNLRRPTAERGPKSRHVDIARHKFQFPAASKARKAFSLN